ncbi:class I SAM-dependent methyltransferase [Pseudoxanthomonas sp. SGD-10]|nr:class I SAM-dependent methyltransferase [Pseudoxanthomonas sp. SGD-10]
MFQIRNLLSFKGRLRIFVLKSYIKNFYSKRGNYYCACCNNSLESFLPYGLVPRKNAICPICNSLERTRLLKYYIVNETKMASHHTHILHFAPEPILSMYLRKFSKNYVSVDIRKGYADKQEDIQSLSFADNSFDYIICSCVLGHVEDEEKAINEMYRVLKVGGKALIITLLNLGVYETLEDDSISTPGQRFERYGEYDLLRLHGEDFLQRLERTNVSVERVEYAEKFSNTDRERFALGNGKREIIYVVEKLAV